MNNYSQNDWRSYLCHGKWTWPDGNNSSEYNAWYYKTHHEKWKRYNPLGRDPDKFSTQTLVSRPKTYGEGNGKAEADKDSPVDWVRSHSYRSPEGTTMGYNRRTKTYHFPEHEMEWVRYEAEQMANRPAYTKEQFEQEKQEYFDSHPKLSKKERRELEKWYDYQEEHLGFKHSDDIPQNDFRRYTELRHHGIMGMHWGIQNGPPYPLEDGDHSASEKKAGWRQSLDSGSGLSKGEMLLVKGTVMDRQQHPAIRGGQIAQGKAPIYKKLNEAGSRLKSKAGAAQKANENWYNRPDGLTQEAQEERRLALVDAEKKYSKALSKEVDNMLGDGNWGPQDRLAVRRAISSAANYQGMMEAYDIKRGDEKQTDMGYWACQMNYIHTEADTNNKRR